MVYADPVRSDLTWFWLTCQSFDLLPSVSGGFPDPARNSFVDLRKILLIGRWEARIKWKPRTLFTVGQREKSFPDGPKLIWAPNGLRVRAKIDSQNWRPDLGQIWMRRLSKPTGIVALFRGFCNWGAPKDDLKMGCENVKLFLREP